MKSVTIDECASLRDVMSIAYQHDDPVTVIDGANECLVVMTPIVFERILFDSGLVNCLACCGAAGERQVPW